MDEYIKKKNNDKAGIKVLETSDVGVVKGCDGLQMCDSVFLPALYELGGHKYPIVFNNACSSWRELGVRFVYAGASIYIGTSVDVPNSLATDVATRFASDLVKGKTVGHSLYKAQIGFITDMGYTPYLMHGYLFTKCVGLQPANDNPKVFLRELTKAVNMWKKHEVESQIEEVKINSEDIAGFLQEELRDLTE